MIPFRARVWAIIVCLSLIAAPRIAGACDYCLLYQGAPPTEAQGMSLRIDSRYLVLGNIYDHGVKSANPFDQQETYFTTQLSAFIPVFSETSFLLAVPLTSRAQHVNSAAAAAAGADIEPSASGAGLGDVSAMLRYRFYHLMGDEWTIAATVSAGFKLPTGATTVHNTAGGYADAHMQLGTGSFDPIVGASLFAGAGDWGFAMTALAFFPGNGARGYRFGNIATVDVAAMYHAFPLSIVETSLFVGAGIGGEWHAVESQDGVGDPNTGGSTVYFTPQARYDMGGWSIDANVQLPLSHNLNGVQLGQSYRLAAGVQYRL